MRSWTVAITRGTLLLRIFRSLGPQQAVNAELDVLELVPSEVGPLSVRVIDIIWSSIRRTTIRCLCIEPKVGGGRDADLIAELESFRDYECDTPRRRLTVCQNGRLLLQWTYWHPGLDRFLERASALHPVFSIGNPQHVSLDLTDFVMKSEYEQRSLLLQLKQLGFHQACVMMLRRRMRMSGIDALRLMNSL